VSVTRAESDRAFIAGASGAIGQRLCRLLVDSGWTVVGTTRSDEKAERLRALGVDPVIVDAFDRAALRDAARAASPGVIVHLLTDLPTALDPARMPEALIRTASLREIGTANLVDAGIAAGAGRMVAQSIAFAYAPGPGPYREESPLDLDDAYFGATVRAILALERQVLQAPFDGIVLRYGKLYGPGTGFDAAPEGGCALQVDDAADAARRAMTRGAPGIYNVCEDSATVSTEKAADALGWKPGFRIRETRS
jgi:nucleoside-diphosphate-sugar epimerase